MSDTTDDMEIYSSCFFDEEVDYEEMFERMESQITELRKTIYGMNIKINNLEKKLKETTNEP